jgi:hypothetical protein
VPSEGGIVDVYPVKATYPAVDYVTLTASPSAGYAFDSWSGHTEGIGDVHQNPVTFLMGDRLDNNRVITANFVPVHASLMEGDVSRNGHVTISDALMIAQYKAGMITLTANQLLCADTNDDGNVSMADAMHIAQWLVDPDGSLGVLHKLLWESPADDSMLQPVA